MPTAAPGSNLARPRICIVSHHAFGALTGGREGHAGGVERQTAMLATWLATRGFAVSMLVWNEGQPEVTEVGGVEVIAMCARDAGWVGARFLHPRWTSLVSAMRRADAALYYHNCGEYVTGQVALWCRRRRRRFVYSVASDPECDPRLPALAHVRERLLFRYGLRHADRIIVQTERQRERLRAEWGLDGLVLPMPCVGPSPGFEPREPDPGRPPRVVWIGRISHEKRLDRLLDIARQLPGIRFEIVGAVDQGNVAMVRWTDMASTLPNVTVRGKVAREEMPAVYEGSACLVCTSDYEGFPNTFLEAWSRGVPVVSTVDPDDVIVSRGLGLVASDTAGLSEQLRRITSDRLLWRASSTNARQYFEGRHSYGAALERFEEVFREVLNRP
jgi:glycosyltransferase involved in cell wall biosynthesis